MDFAARRRSCPHGWGRGSGVPVEISFFTVFECGDGKVQRIVVLLRQRKKHSKPPGCRE